MFKSIVTGERILISKVVLFGEELEVSGDRQDFGFGVEMFFGGHTVAASRDAEASVLASLETVDGGGGGISGPDGGGKVDTSADKLLVGDD